MRLAKSRTICVLPYGRVKLFLSALITVLIVSVPIPLLGVLEQVVVVPPSVAAMQTASQRLATGVYLFGWFYAGITVLLSLLVRRLFHWLRQRGVQTNDA